MGVAFTYCLRTVWHYLRKVNRSFNIPESNRQSAEWRAAGENYLKRAKTQQSTGKLITSVVWDARGIIFIDFLEKRKSSIANIS